MSEDSDKAAFAFIPGLPTDLRISSVLPPLAGSLWTVGAPPPAEGGDIGATPAVAVPDALKPALDRLRQLDVQGVQSARDVEAFIDVVLELEVLIERKGERDRAAEASSVWDQDWQAEFDRRTAGTPARYRWWKSISLLAHVVREFRRHGIPVSVGDGGSATRRNPREFRERMDLPARTYGIHLERGARTSTVIHEMTHAVPGGDFVRSVLGDAKDIDEMERRALRWPVGEVDDAPTSGAFIDNAGAMFRDEAYAGLAVAALAEIYELGGIPVTELVKKIRDAARLGIPGYVRSGVYLGDNHLLLYNLSSLLEAFQRVGDDPSAARREAYGTMPQGLLGGRLDANPLAMVRRFRMIWAEVWRFLAALNRDAKSVHPLKPLATRLAPIASEFGIDLQTTAKEMETVDVRPRPGPRARGTPSWIDERRASAEEGFALVSEFAQAAVPVLPVILRHGEYEALAILAMTIPDEDLPRFWSMVMSKVRYYGMNLGGEADGSTFPLLQPLVLQGYLEEARTLLPGLYRDPLFGEQWVDALMDGFEAVARTGDEAAVDFWIGEVEGEEATGWMRRYREAVLVTAKRSGRFTGDGRKRLAALFERSGFLSDRDVFEELYALTEEGLYLPLYYEKGSAARAIFGDPARTKSAEGGDPEGDEIEDAFDFAQRWAGREEVQVAASQFIKHMPTPVQIERMARAAEVLRDRGLAVASERLSRLAARLLPWRIGMREAAIQDWIIDRYVSAEKPMRRSNTFLQHMERLGSKERDVLPLPATLVAEALAVVRTPAHAGGGWSAALDLLEAIPESFTGAAAYLRLARELRHAPPLADADRARYLRLWERNLEAVVAAIPNAAFIEPEEEGLIAFDAREQRFFTGFLHQGFNSFYSRASESYAARHRAMMLAVARGGGGAELEAQAAAIERRMAFSGVAGIRNTIRVVPTLYNPMQAVEEVFLRRNLRPRLVYEVGFDPNLFPLEAAVVQAASAPDADRVEEVAASVRHVVQELPATSLAPYVSLLLELSVAAQEAGDIAKSVFLYEEARALGEQLRTVNQDAFSLRYAYNGPTPEVRAFDLQTRHRRFQSTWEAASLPLLARLAIAAGDEGAGPYLVDIRRIVDNESIFDVMGSAEYADAARRLDASGMEPGLVADLFERAIQARLREQFEANYDVDHELAVDIDASGLPAGERDRLLALLVEVTLKRTYRSHQLQGTDTDHKRDLLDRTDQLLSPLHILLEIVERRPYPETERALWAGLRQVAQGVGDQMPASLYPLILSRAARIVLERHPELVHPGVQETAAQFEWSRRFPGSVDAVFTSVFGGGRQRSIVAELPSFWEITEALRTAGGNSEKVLGMIIAAVPERGEVDPYVLETLNAFFLEEMQSLRETDLLPWKEGGNPDSVSALLRKRGYPDSWEGFLAMANDEPALVRSVILKRLGRVQARTLSWDLIAMAENAALPLDIRVDAFQGLVRGGFISDYLSARFEEARLSPGRTLDFLSRVSLVWDKPDEEGGEEGEGRRPRMLPDWLIAPLFEPLLAAELEAVEEALARGPVVDENFEEFDGGEVRVYNYLVTAWSEPGEFLMQRFADDGAYFLDRLRTITANITEFVRSVREGGADRGWIEPTGSRTERAVVRAYRRNNVVARAGTIPLPKAFANIHPTLRLVIADYIAHIPASTRVLLMGAMRRTEEELGENEVLRLFFELTGQEKLAQFLSVQEGVVPEGYRRKLSVFHEDLKPSTAQEVVDTLKMSGIPPGTAFVPGSLAFEHAGTVGELWSAMSPDGRRLAMKILPWKKERRNREAIRALERVADDMQLFRHQLFGGVDMKALYQRFRETLGAEMNYRREMANLDRMAPTMERFGIAFPRVDRTLLRQNVMVMEHLPSMEISALEPEMARILMERTGAWLAHAIFVDGFFYEDFHPGNIKWLPAAAGRPGQPLVFDFGRAGEFTTAQRRALIEFLIAATTQDATATAAALGAMSVRRASNRGDLVQEIGTLLASPNGHPSGRVQALFGLAARHGLDLEPAYLQFIKAILSWEGVMRSIDPDVDFSTYAVPAILEALAQTKPPDDPGGGSGGTPGSPSGSPSGGTTSFGGITIVEGTGETSAPAGDAGDSDIAGNPFVGGGIFVGEDAMPMVPPMTVVAPPVFVP